MPIRTKQPLNKSQFNILTSYNPHRNKEDIFRQYICKGSDIERHFTFEELFYALAYGYELKKTPEEIIKEHFDCLGDMLEDTSLKHSRAKVVGKRKGIITTLNMLGITIEGVNDDADL